jgi:hypothetical protein
MQILVQQASLDVVYNALRYLTLHSFKLFFVRLSTCWLVRNSICLRLLERGLLGVFRSLGDDSGWQLKICRVWMRGGANLSTHHESAGLRVIHLRTKFVALLGWTGGERWPPIGAEDVCIRGLCELTLRRTRLLMWLRGVMRWKVEFWRQSIVWSEGKVWVFGCVGRWRFWVERGGLTLSEAGCVVAHRI